MAALRVLAVDDAPEVRHLVRAYLRAETELVLCADAAAAIAAFTAAPPDVALIDLSIGDECGYQLLATLRALRGGATTRMVAMTASTSAHDRARIQRAGFDGYLAKPLGREQVWRALAPIPDGSSDDARPAALARDLAIEEMLPELLATVAASAHRLPDHLAAGAHDEVRRIGHRIAGSGGLLGFDAIGELGRALEHAAIARDEAEMVRLATALCRDVDDAVASLPGRSAR